MTFAGLYPRFQAPIADLDCGERCAPYNERGVPFCCDLRHAVPTAYLAEWAYLERSTQLWRLFETQDQNVGEHLRAKTPENQVLIACQGHQRCQRDFRALTCRAFPFFPYITRQGEFIGLSYYWEYQDLCWVISNLNRVTEEYRRQFIEVYDWILDQMPEEHKNFRYQSMMMRRAFARRRRMIPLLHRNGSSYKIAPRSGRLRGVPVEQLPKYGPYKIAADLPFPDECV
jgi:hypothetical protein